MIRGLFFLLLFLASFPLAAAEFTNGQLRLVLHERTGRFSLYTYDRRSLFDNGDPRTSFLSVLANGRYYRMGNSSAFRTRLVRDPHSPAIIYESSFLIVTKEFLFLQNGLRVMITLENKTERPITAGARFLLDTFLSEKNANPSFTTDRRTITSEALLTNADSDSFWTDANNDISLFGSIDIGSPTGPDSIHFANWKRLNDARWSVPFQPRRNFNLLPFSIRDTAVCYYFDPRPLPPGEQRTFWFSLYTQIPLPQETQPFVSAATGFCEQDLAAIRELINQIDRHIASGGAADEEIASLENKLQQIRARHQ